MPRHPDSGRLDLSEVFLRVQSEMLAQLRVGGVFEHASSMGAATEHHWLELFARYLPKRYRATPAFVIDSAGHRSRQIDIAIFDNLYSPPLFPHESGQHIPAESIYAVFEVKPTISRQWIRDAGEKAASVRALHRTSVPVIAGGRLRDLIKPSPILAGLLATSSVWSAAAFEENVRTAVLAVDPLHRLDLGCSLEHGSFEYNPTNDAAPTTRPISVATPAKTTIAATTPTSRVRKGGGKSGGLKTVQVSSADEALIFFILRLLERLRAMGTAPAADLMEYGRSLRSFVRRD